MRLKTLVTLLIAAQVLLGQTAPSTGRYHSFTERLRMASNNVSDADLDRTEKNADWVREYLGKTWSLQMLLRGHDYKQPVLIDGARGYFSTLPWKCEGGIVLQLDNAEYCAASNTISYDGYFLAGISKKIALLNHSPGAFATIVVVAHEHGHALQYQLGITSIFDFANEQNADCFAGATAYQMQLDGHLGPSDLAEATATLTLLADKKRASLGEKDAHGDASQRVGAFMQGFRSGPPGCASALKPLPTPWRPNVLKP